MNDFTDLVRKITAIDLDEDTSASNANPYKPVEEAVVGTRDTANILKAFSAIESDTVNEEARVDEASVMKSLKRGMKGWDKSMTGLDGEKNTPQQMRKRVKDADDDFLKSLAKGSDKGDSPAAVQARMAKQELKKRGVTEGNAQVDEAYPSPLDEPKAVAAREKMKKTLKGIRKDKPKHPATVNVREGKTTEDIVGDLRTRFADFLKAEVQQGNDLNTISAAVQEGTASAQAINRSFDSMFSIMERLVKMTREGGVLYKQVEQEGGDPSWIEDANEKLSAAYSALEEAHMYALPMSTEDE